MSRRATQTADTALLNGRVWTGRSARPYAEAVAILGERIVAVESTSEVEALCGPGTRRLQLGGRLVVPGLHDSHVHFAGGCLQLQRVRLKDARDEAEFGKRLRQSDRDLPPSAWILGGHWDHDLTFGGAWPTAALVDRYVPGRPVFLHRYDGHMAVANSVALRRARVTRDTPDPFGGRIVRDPGTGGPAGVLQDAAMGLVSRHVPGPSAQETAEALPAGLELAARRGVTCLHDMLGDGGACLGAYEGLCQRGELTVRLHLYWPVTDWRRATELAPRSATSRSRSPGERSAGSVASHLQVCGVKAFVDGSLGSSTAWFHEPYAHEPGHCGLPVVGMGELTEQLREADRAGLQLAVHAIGDRAVSELLDAWERVAAANGPRDRRLRLEHAQHIRPGDVRRCADLGVIASVQPYHLIDDGRWAAERIGEERCAQAFPLRALQAAGVSLACGSDWPVAPLDPLAGIDAAANRRTVDGRHPGGWHPEQRLTVEGALRGYTEGAARALFAEAHLGRLEPGKLADLVVLAQDITDPANQEAISETEVLLTMVGGRIVREALG